MPNMKLTSMKLDPKAMEEKYKGDTMPVERAMYPWGLQVNLDNDALETLGLTKLPAVGKPMMLVARVDVTSVSENETQDGGKKRSNRSVSLQITEMALGPDEKGDEPKAQDALYKK